MSDALPEVLAGPFLRYTTPTEAYVWLATSVPLTPRDIRVEFWDPAPFDALPIQDEPKYSVPGMIRGWSSVVQSLQVASCLWVHVVGPTGFTPRLVGNKVYAYRVVLYPSQPAEAVVPPGGTPTPGGTLERLGHGGPGSPDANPKPFASFVLSQPTNFWIWGLPSQAVTQLTAAGVRLQTMVQHDPGDKPGAARLPKPAPNAAFFFGNPWTFGPAISEKVFEAILALARDLAGPRPQPPDWYQAVYAAAYLLAWSPTLCQQRLPAPLGPSAEPLPRLTEEESLGGAVEATACIMANTPSYVLGTSNATAILTERATEGAGGIAGGVLGALARVASIFVNAAFADWPNAPDSVTSFDLVTLARAVSTSGASLARSFVVPQQPAVGCAAAGDSIAKVLADKTNTGAGAEKDHQAISDRIPTVVSVDPVLRRTDGATREPHAVVKQHDVTLIMSFTGGRAFIAESGPALDAKPAATFAPSGDGSLHGKVLEVAASLGGAPDSRPPTTKNVTVPTEVSEARYASLQRTGDSVTMSLEPTASDADSVKVLLPAHGRIVPLKSGPDRLHLGNRFRKPCTPAQLKKGECDELKHGQGDDEQLKDVGVALYDEVNGRRVRGPAKASATGQVDLDLSGLNGGYKLRIQGDGLTYPHAGPDTPAFDKRTKQFRPRVWKAHEFDVEIADGAWRSIDHEPVPSGPFRLLIDPVWMQAHKARSSKRAPRPKAPGKAAVRFVDLLVLHSTDVDDARTTADGWMYDKPGKNVSANYLVARDGTVIKFVDESMAAHHTGPWNQWRDKSSNNPPALNQFAVGIELAKSDNSRVLFTERQYEALLGSRSPRRLGLLELLLGRDSGKAAISGRRAGSPNNPDYIDIDIRDTEVIGHGDCRLLTFKKEQGGGGTDILGGKTDPTLAFEWARLEQAGIGLRRPDLLAPLTGHQPTTESTHREPGKPGQRWHATDGWAQQQKADETRGYADVCNDVNGGTLVEPSDDVIKKRVFNDLKKLGYWVGNNPDDGKTDRTNPKGKKVGAPFQKAITAFRTHFFSGERRTLAFTDPNNQLESGNEEADYVLDRVTVVWIYKVALYVDQLRNAPTTP